MRSFRQYRLVEDKVEALLRLAASPAVGQLPPGHRPATEYFFQPMASPQLCRDMQALADEDRRGRLSGYRRESLNPRLFIPTQYNINLTNMAEILRKVIKTPVLVGRLNGKYYLIDGHHRAAAALHLGYSSVLADVINLTPIQ